MVTAHTHTLTVGRRKMIVVGTVEVVGLLFAGTPALQKAEKLAVQSPVVWRRATGIVAAYFCAI